MKKQTLHDAPGVWGDRRNEAAPYRHTDGSPHSMTAEYGIEDLEASFRELAPRVADTPLQAGFSANGSKPADLFLELHCLADYLAWEHGAMPSEYRAIQAGELLRSAITTVGRAAANRQILVQHSAGKADTASIWDVFRLEKLFLHLLWAVVDATPAGGNMHLISEGIPDHSNLGGAEPLFQLHIICGFSTDEARRQSITRLESHRSFALAYHLNTSISGNIAYSLGSNCKVVWQLQLPLVREPAIAGAKVLKALSRDLFPHLNKADAAFLDAVYHVFEREVENHELSTEVIARMLTMSRAKLHRKLTAITGKSAHELLNDYRLEHAQRLLREEGCNVSEAAWQSGFSNTKYFSTAFKKKFGLSPSNLTKDTKPNLFGANSNP